MKLLEEEIHFDFKKYFALKKDFTFERRVFVKCMSAEASRFTAHTNAVPLVVRTSPADIHPFKSNTTVTLHQHVIFLTSLQSFIDGHRLRIKQFLNFAAEVLVHGSRERYDVVIFGRLANPRVVAF